MRCNVMADSRRRVSRRSFFGKVLAGGTFLLMGSGGRPLRAGPRLDRVRADDFTNVAAPRFEMIVPGCASRELVLTEIRVQTPDPARPRTGLRREPFSLLFSGAAGDTVPQGTYRLRHEEIGTLELFLVPVGPFPEGCRYEAVFN